MRRSIGVALACTLLAAPAVTACSPGDDTASAAADSSEHATAAVTRKDLARTQDKSGSLSYGETRELLTDLPGTVTALPPNGRAVRNGGVLYRIDTAPVLRLDGAVPAWRALGPGVEDGVDVEQLEKALHALGYADDLTVDEAWTAGTTAAVKEWQEDLGIEETGSLPLGQVVFTRGDLRVVDRVADIGDRVQPGAAILQVSDTTRLVTVSLDPSDKDLAPLGGKLALTFPDGTKVTGQVRSVVMQPADEATQQQESLRVTISLPDTKAVTGQYDGSSVQVAFREVLATDVLTVPVTGLVALDGGGYGVEKVGADGSTTYVSVTPGTFADTDVEVTGDELAEGDKVVVTP